MAVVETPASLRTTPADVIFAYCPCFFATRRRSFGVGVADVVGVGA
jgi:hypothetical protein